MFLCSPVTILHVLQLAMVLPLHMTQHYIPLTFNTTYLIICVDQSWSFAQETDIYLFHSYRH